MSSWAVAGVAALALALVLYRWREPGGLTRRAPLIALRALALAVVLALLLDAPLGAARPISPFVALDVSASWTRGNDTAAWNAALRQVRTLPRDSLYLFGDSARVADVPDRPRDLSSRARPAIERALAAGRPLTIITDGELDDPAELPALPTGSRIEVIPHTASNDVAVIALDAPRAAVSGDTVEIRATVRAADSAPDNARLAFALNGRTLAIGGARSAAIARRAHGRRACAARVARWRSPPLGGALRRRRRAGERHAGDRDRSGACGARGARLDAPGPRCAVHDDGAARRDLAADARLLSRHA